jgi:hypothetical protein
MIDIGDLDVVVREERKRAVKRNERSMVIRRSQPMVG